MSIPLTKKNHQVKTYVQLGPRMWWGCRVNLKQNIWLGTITRTRTLNRPQKTLIFLCSLREDTHKKVIFLVVGPLNKYYNCYTVTSKEVLFLIDSFSCFYNIVIFIIFLFGFQFVDRAWQSM